MDFSRINSDLQNFDLMESDSLFPPTLFEGSEQHVDSGQTLIGGAEAVITASHDDSFATTTEGALSHQYRALPPDSMQGTHPSHLWLPIDGILGLGFRPTVIG